MNVLVIDIGGSHIKLMLSSLEEKRKFDTGPDFTAEDFEREIKQQTEDLQFDAVSIGFPAPVLHGSPAADPNNLGKGWIGFDFQQVFKQPVKLINDATLQAIGSYEGGRMLFLGLGTGLGSALIVNDVVVSIELSQLRYSDDESLEDRVGKRALKKRGQTKWEAAVHEIVANLQRAFVTDYVVIGGGNARRLEKVPKGSRLGSNENAFLGGLRLWGEGGPTGKTKPAPLTVT